MKRFAVRRTWGAFSVTLSAIREARDFRLRDSEKREQHWAGVRKEAGVELRKGVAEQWPSQCQW